jgi:hypothetical protein
VNANINGAGVGARRSTERIIFLYIFPPFLLKNMLIHHIIFQHRISDSIHHQLVISPVCESRRPYKHS